MDKEAVSELFVIRKKFRDDKISKEELLKTHSTFAEKFEQSFNMICNPTCDDNTLNKIMNAHLLVQNGKMSQHDASVAVGQTLVDTYVKPTLDNAGMKY